MPRPVRPWFPRLALAAVFVAALAVTARPAGAPVAIDDTTWDVEGKVVIKVKRIGKDKSDVTGEIEFKPGKVFEATDGFNSVEGKYETKGACENKLIGVFGPMEIMALDDFLEGVADDVGREFGVIGDIAVDIPDPTKAKLKGKVKPDLSKLKVVLKVKFVATIPLLGDRKAKYKVKLKGPMKAP